MASINLEISSNHGPVNITKNLYNEKFYSFQMISPLGGVMRYILVDGSAYPDAPPKIAHLLKNHAVVQLKVKATESVWAWAGVGCVLVVSEASSVKAV